ncbi:MAG TPA: PIG-L family deacetylase [Streptosporangiaceae bacterium]|nr:PIG-L family deacetylase [Streptosporangiaceae bacterium]
MGTEYEPTPRGRILLVEDDPDTARFIMHVLGDRAGFDIERVPDPAVALPRIGPEHWDLLIIDIEMPDMTGIELLETARRQAPALPVAVITAYVPTAYVPTAHRTVDNTLGALRGRADEFLRKPLRPDVLAATVTALIARGRSAPGGREVVLAVGAHPDDVEIGAAGTLLAHRAAGHKVAILTMSAGARGGPDDARAGAARKAATILRAALYLEDLEDTRISESDPTISAISAVIEAVRPTIVYTHSIHDVHQDHRNTHRAVMVAAREVGSVCCFQSPSATVDFRPTRFIVVDEYMSGKLAAIAAFASQATVRQHLAPDLTEATARYWSRFGSGRYAEAFEVVRDHAAGPAGGWTDQPALGAAKLSAAVGEYAPDEGAAHQILEDGHVTT